MFNNPYFGQPAIGNNQPNAGFVNNSMSINAVFGATVQNFGMQPPPQQAGDMFASLLGALVGNLLIPPPPPQPKSNNNLFSILFMLLLNDCGCDRRPAWRGPDYGPPPPPPPPPLPPLPPVYTKAVTTNTAKVWGDPHFVGFFGGNYDVMGKPGDVYTILSDQNFQYNAKFKAWGGNNNATVIQSVGFKVGSGNNETRIQFDVGGTPTLNGQAMEKNREYNNIDTGLMKDGHPVLGTAKWDGTKLVVNTGEYEITLQDKGGYLDQSDLITDLGVNSDGVMPHGLLGQSADGKAHNGKTGAGAQGEGAIEGVYTDYQVLNGDLFGDPAKFNKYQTAAEGQAVLGQGAGQTAQAQ